MPEPHIVINGVPLSKAQAMTVRAAIENFAVRLQRGLGARRDDRAMTRINEIRSLFVYGERREGD